MSEKFKALDAGDPSDFSFTEEPMCPHCGGELNIAHNDEWRLYDENDTHDVECPSCHQEFQVNSYATWRFSTDEQERQP